MESQAVRRRINTISSHLGAGMVTEDVTSPTTHLFPLNCSSNLSTTFRRLDSRLHYGRQSSASQGAFMRQAAISSLEQGNSARSCGNSIEEEKSPDPRPPLFSRPRTAQPMFARPKAEYNNNNVGVFESLTQDKKSPSSQCSNFARPTEETTETEEKQFSSRRQTLSPQTNETEWSPRKNVAESNSSYIITIELPGVDVRDIRVEMDGKNLIVRGKRSMKWWTAAGCLSDSFATYHKREISQGPYQVMWPLPAGANKDSVSAEFVEGLLQITIPKL